MELRKRKPTGEENGSPRKKRNRRRRLTGETKEAFQYRVATELNELRWKHQREHEKCPIEDEPEDPEEREKLRHRRGIYRAIMLSKVILSVQEALQGENHDEQKAIDSLEELSKQPFTVLSLMYAPYVVKTVYQCRKYQGNEKIQDIAWKCYQRFKPLFGIPAGETFESTFQKEVREFWKNPKYVSYNIAKHDWENFDMNKNTEDDEMEVEVKENNVEITAELNHVGEEDTDEDSNDSLVKREMNSLKVKQEIEDKNQIKGELNIDIKQEIPDDDEEDDDDDEDTELIHNIKTEVPDQDCQIEMEFEVKQEVPGDEDEEEENDEATDEDTNSDCLEVQQPDKQQQKVFDCNDISEDFSRVRVKLEPLSNLKMEYDQERDCYIVE